MTTLWRIHGQDELGSFAIDCYSYEEFNECRANIKADGNAWDLWFEEYDDEEGWQG